MKTHPEVAHEVALMIKKITKGSPGESDPYTHDVAEKLVRCYLFADTLSWLRYMAGYEVY
jgi:hypothetical protein